MIDESGELWRGDDFADLAEFVTDFEPEGHEVERVVEAVCGPCGGRVFRVLADDGNGARRECAGCGGASFIADSGEYWDEQNAEYCGCPCGGEEFNLGVGFSLYEEGDVRWISIGLRCVADGTLGVYAGWKVGYGPSAHLLNQV
ncbi:hypothetical protein [Actinomadura macrotermitis]|uniref:hypothetical protein n=1 Tax=Actinomadura macrotermitis TaxID=2585200 RepID=UPI001A9B6588|nr:hypothetical protein [Actinomadura macrotermitis]